MLRSFFIITLRILWRNKLTSLISILGMTIGMTAFILIMLYVHHETQYDKFNTNYKRIYRLEGDDFAKLPPVIGEHVNNHVPEVEKIARVSFWGRGFISYSAENAPEDLRQIEVNSHFADNTLFDVFTFEFKKGNPTSALRRPHTVVLAERIAKNLFGNANPIGKRVGFWDYDFEVTGIIADEKYAHFDAEVFISFESIKSILAQRNLNKTAANSWFWSATYLLTGEDSEQQVVEENINLALAGINHGGIFDTIFERFSLRPLGDIYFKGSVKNLDYGLHGNLDLVRLFAAAAFFILLLAIINYVNLTTARSSLRSKELALKKISGSSSLVLRSQIIAESIVISAIAFISALTVVQTVLAPFSNLTMVSIDLAEVNNPQVWIVAVTGVIFIGVLAGFYPSRYLIRFETRSLALNNGKGEARNPLLRQVLMTFQFLLSMVLIIAAIVNFRQLEFTRSADLGFNKERIIVLNTPADYSLNQTFDDRLSSYSEIIDVSFSAGQVGTPPAPIPMQSEGDSAIIGFYCIDPDFIDLMEMQIIKGSNFSYDRRGELWSYEDWSRDRIYGIILNETAVKEFGFAEPVGKILTYEHSKNQISKFTVIGVVKDFHFQSMHHQIGPLGMIWKQEYLANIKISGHNIPGTIKIIEKESKEVYGNQHIRYQFIDERYDRQYQLDDQLAKVIGIFTSLAIFIACMGLFGVSSFIMTRRIKEIGIRKVLGASITSIYLMLAWDFIKWIFLAVSIAIPIAWYLMNSWLENFAYHITISLDIFILATTIGILITLLTITGQSLKTARANPVEALRYE